MVGVLRHGDAGGAAHPCAAEGAIAKIGRASWRGRGEISVGAGSLKKKKKKNRAWQAGPKSKRTIEKMFEPWNRGRSGYHAGSTASAKCLSVFLEHMRSSLDNTRTAR